MSRFVYADGDRLGSVQRRRERDRAFLATVMALRDQGDFYMLGRMLRQRENQVEWRQVAIKRAIKTAIVAGEKGS